MSGLRKKHCVPSRHSITGGFHEEIHICGNNDHLIWMPGVPQGIEFMLLHACEEIIYDFACCQLYLGRCFDAFHGKKTKVRIIMGVVQGELA